jgi:hypothetical protein
MGYRIAATDLTLTARTIPANDPEAVPLASMVRLFPLVGCHRARAHLDDEIANREAGILGHSHEIAVSPFRTVTVHHVGNLGEQETVRLQDSVCLFQERRIQITESPVMLFAAGHVGAKVHVEAFNAFIAPLRTDVRWIIDHGSELRRAHAFHDAIVCNDHRLVPGVNIHRHDGPSCPFPDPAGIVGRIKNRLGVNGRIERERGI